MVISIFYKCLAKKTLIKLNSVGFYTPRGNKRQLFSIEYIVYLFDFVRGV